MVDPLDEEALYRYASFIPLYSQNNSAISPITSGGGGTATVLNPVANETTRSSNFSPAVRRDIGAKSVNAGVTILMVPDPLPFIDEVAGVALIGFGLALIVTSY